MAHEAMAVVAEQRERLAERVRPPWWYWTVMTAATVAILVSQVVDARLSTAAVGVVVTMGLFVRMQRAIRTDIRSGRVRP
ncbi:hypothetical protein [Actinomycetospora soli]|uniref:hypothetical protein n=1 Tax=Actinomycetospora soli TaxID=2893887 RepID=UPI001E4082AD|nr:hypothetical protein [Actinomycetospora soli]MCD2189096.1 hypothetical protein [Actinomycetospora soli]